MSFRNKVITLIIGLTLAFAGSLGSYAYFTSIATANDNTITLGTWINPKPTDVDKSKAKPNEATKPIQKVDRDKVSEKATIKIKDNNLDKSKGTKKAKIIPKEKSNEFKQKKNIDNTNNKGSKKHTKKEVKAEKQKTNIEKNKTIENNVQNNEENK